MEDLHARMSTYYKATSILKEIMTLDKIARANLIYRSNVCIHKCNLFIYL